MANDLATIETQLGHMAPQLSQALGGIMPVDRLIRTVIVSVERLPALLSADRQSVFMAAMSAACLGLEVDGVTGQAYLIPFKGKAQLVIGYKGFNTLAARGGISISGNVVREGDDEWDFRLGSGGFVRHKPSLARARDRRIIAAYAVAEHRDRPPVIEVIGIDDIEAVKEKSPGARMRDSPWNDPGVGFPAMAAKTAKRRLQRSLPLVPQFAVAAAMDQAFEEEGVGGHVEPGRGFVPAIEAKPATPYEANETPTSAQILAGPDEEADYEALIKLKISELDGPALAAWWNSQRGERGRYSNDFRIEMMEVVRKAIDAKRTVPHETGAQE